jgi:hypothetical protein
MAGARCAPPVVPKGGVVGRRAVVASLPQFTVRKPQGGRTWLMGSFDRWGPRCGSPCLRYRRLWPKVPWVHPPRGLAPTSEVSAGRGQVHCAPGRSMSPMSLGGAASTDRFPPAWRVAQDCRIPGVEGRAIAEASVGRQWSFAESGFVGVNPLVSLDSDGFRPDARGLSAASSSRRTGRGVRL